jgi:alkylation response protein AidB-like acyl-CoA dehydrogenase
MALVLNEEQALLQQTAREFIEEKSPVSELRRLRDSKDPDGIDRALWTEMAELGWAGVTLPEDLGGMELGWLELGVLFEECGRTLTAHPLLSTVALAGECIRRGGSDTQRKEQLAPVAAGERLLALALQEGPHHDPLRVATRAEPGGDGHVLRGSKTQVLDGHIADALLVVARSAGESGERDGLSLFLVDPGARGVRITRTTMIDGRNAANVELDGVEVAADALVGEAGRGADVLEPALDRATAVLCAEMVGTMSVAFDKTVEYLKTREQFGVPIGSFQALKHRAAEMFVELELSRAIVLDALSALDAGRNGAAELVSCAKARCNDTIFRIGNEAVQMHGGIGVTDEEDIGLYLKRARVAQFTLGNSAFHRDRFARLEGY